MRELTLLIKQSLTEIEICDSRNASRFWKQKLQLESEAEIASTWIIGSGLISLFLNDLCFGTNADFISEAGFVTYHGTIKNIEFSMSPCSQWLLCVNRVGCVMQSTGEFCQTWRWLTRMKNKRRSLSLQMPSSVRTPGLFIRDASCVSFQLRLPGTHATGTLHTVENSKHKFRENQPAWRTPCFFKRYYILRTPYMEGERAR